MARYDVVVVGAGPGGAATAAHLADAGASVLVLDRSSFPRDKACGGGLTPRGVAAVGRLGLDADDPMFVRVGGLELVGDGRRSSAPFPVTRSWPDFGLVARRRDLDHALVERAAKAGAELREGVRVLGPVVEDGTCRGVRIASPDGGRQEVLAPWVVAADGATSVMARGLGLAPRSSGGGFWYTAFRSYMAPVEPRRSEDGPLLEFYPLRTPSGRWLPAYGWVFPLPDGTANVGVDVPHRPALSGAPGLREAYTAFVERLRRNRPGFADAREQAPPQGALLPEAMAGFRPGAPGLLCVGDAAGLITPYSGEGIAYALESGELAASVLTADGQRTRTLAAYEDRLWDAYGFQFRTSLWVMKAMRRAPLAWAAATAGIGRDRPFAAAVRVMTYLIEDDPDSTVCVAYRAARRVARLRPRSLWR